VRWYGRSAAQNDGDALNAMGCVHETGAAGVRVDLRHAEELYARAVAATRRGVSNTAARNLAKVCGREREGEELLGSHGRWKRPCLQTAHMAI
jgi:hypothetical protein